MLGARLWSADRVRDIRLTMLASLLFKRLNNRLSNDTNRTCIKQANQQLLTTKTLGLPSVIFLTIVVDTIICHHQRRHEPHFHGPEKF